MEFINGNDFAQDLKDRGRYIPLNVHCCNHLVDGWQSQDLRAEGRYIPPNVVASLGKDQGREPIQLGLW